MTITIHTTPAAANAVAGPKQIAWLAPGRWEVRTGADLVSDAVPQTLSARQFWLAIEDAGLTTAVNAAVAAAPKRTQLEVAKATEFDRNYPTLITLAAAIGKDAAAIDALFRAGVLL